MGNIHPPAGPGKKEPCPHGYSKGNGCSSQEVKVFDLKEPVVWIASDITDCALCGKCVEVCPVNARSKGLFLRNKAGSLMKGYAQGKGSKGDCTPGQDA
ncbi:MAG: hypothetical protein CVV44_11190 [Spirochaetae bacterium HGW-Spirochaetae-1]|nr:MAG: hypothetical protein CVV44_11190 [Spirochaetae bacterium HGW-Spirochaetae-1]